MKTDIKHYPLTPDECFEIDESYQRDYIGSMKELRDMRKEKDLEPVNYNL